ncbi:uncharacterized protein TNCV_1142891 [Trichonephila clavipes]|nr:uncharacterized protein TNCV_1142891 [Trichonephila clavipes]
MIMKCEETEYLDVLPGRGWKPNYRIWGTSPPNNLHQQPLHPNYVTAWCRFTAEFILGPFFFQTLTPQDEATPHIGRQVKALLIDKFSDNRVISRHFPDVYPSRSPDLSSWDFWLWGFLRDRVYRGGIRTLPDLKASIIRHVAEIPPELLCATIEKAIIHFQHVIDASGAHIDIFFEPSFYNKEYVGVDPGFNVQPQQPHIIPL